ncbi:MULTISPECIES: hypothetical protein [unclassified Myroides]|uniref:hypothetical protein n=1 Tax=unclassified Myroides TaxID=2642485 RepID=UPI003D2F8A92
MEKTFYCKIHTGTDFCIDEYNNAAKELENTGVPLKDQIKILHPDSCSKQCQDCIDETLDTRLKTQKLVDALINKKV